MPDLLSQVSEARVPLVNRRNRWVMAIGSLVQGGILLKVTLEGVTGTGIGGWIALGLIGTTLLVFLGITLRTLLCYGWTTFILDAQGIRLEGRHSNEIRWEDVVGYDLRQSVKEPVLRIRGRKGKPIEIPNLFGISVTAAEIGIVTRELDRRLGPDGDRPSLPVLPDKLDALLQHHYGHIPAIELEPGVVYRYIDPEALAEDAKSRAWSTAGIVALLVPAVALATRFPAYTSLIVAAVGLAMLPIAVVIAQSLTLAYGFRDRFVRRGNEIWRIRHGREILLSRSGSGPVRKIFDQPTTVHGKGLFAYRMAPQFLEPDV